MFGVIFIGLNVILLIFIMLNANFKGKKECEYKNDERWQAIQGKVSKVINKYYEILMGIAAIGSIAVAIFGANTNFEMYLTLEQALSFSFMALASINAVELFALRFYDSKM